MKFAVVTLVVGFSGAVFAATVQGSPSVPADLLPAANLDTQITGSTLPKTPDAVASDGVRLIDLKSGTSCKAATPPVAQGMTAAPLGPDCARSPSLAKIAYWRSTADGSLIMADAGGHKVLEFAPGDGVMYESVYPANELITIVPARG